MTELGCDLSARPADGIESDADRMDRYVFMNAVAQPLLVKDGELYLVADSCGEIPPGSVDGFGLFYRDTRYLSGHQIRICGEPLMSLMASSAPGNAAVVELANEEFEKSGQHMPRQLLGVRWEKQLDGSRLTLREKALIRSYAAQEISFTLEFVLYAAFEDIFQLRGSSPRRRGMVIPVIESPAIRFVYHGADGIQRSLTTGLSGGPRLVALGNGCAHASFDLALAPQQTHEIEIIFQVDETGRDSGPSIRPLHAEGTAPSDEDTFAGVAIETDNARLNDVLAQSLRDIRLLTTSFDGRFIAGGMPWFVSPFARDSAISAIQILPFSPDLARDAARHLAVRQGQRHVPETGEEPGKIPHELRFGEMANLGEIDQRPNYRSIDATPLFLILIHEHFRWTRDLALVGELRANFDAALQWLFRALEEGSGYVTYSGISDDGLRNEGWKDSGESVIRRDGSLPRPPIALCEVQGHAFAALRGAANLLRETGDEKAAERAEKEAEALRLRFNSDFWMEGEKCFAMALEDGARQVESVTSNSGQALWSGIADPERAIQVCRRLTEPDMWSGWGIRTLSNVSPAYNPIHYHLGSVWPFDNSLILAGMRRHRADAAACDLFDDVFAAISRFNEGRAPEFYVGLQREPGLPPARCPLAEPLQAWSAGAVPFMLLRLLGLEPDVDGPSDLVLVRPQLPKSIGRVRLEGLHIGGRRAELDICRNKAGKVELTASQGARIRIVAESQ